MIEKIKVNVNEEGKTKRILKYVFKKTHQMTWLKSLSDGDLDSLVIQRSLKYNVSMLDS